MISPVKISSTFFAVPTTGVMSSATWTAPGTKPFLVNIASGKTNREDRSDDRNRLEKFLGNLPGASLHNSFFWFRRHQHSLIPVSSNSLSLRDLA